MVWAEYPGTIHHSRACVYTMNAGALKLLWRMTDSQMNQLDHSSFVVSQSDVVYVGNVNNDPNSSSHYTFRWSTSSNTFTQIN